MSIEEFFQVDASERVSKERVLDALMKFPHLKLLVVGDVMLDHYIWGDSKRISPEAPVPVVSVEEENYRLGGAANVAHNIAALGGRVMLSGVVGNDPQGEILEGLARDRGIEWIGWSRDGRPTTQKLRVVARGQQLLRIDRETVETPSSEDVECFKKGLVPCLDGVCGIIVSDYAKGVVCGPVMDLLKEAKEERSIPLLVDPKPSNMEIYKGVDVVTPNRKEAEVMAGPAGESMPLKGIMERLLEVLSARSVLVTLGEHGMVLIEEEGRISYIPTMAKEVFDVTGAGDTVIATLAMGVASGLDLIEASFLANVAAGLVVAKVGTAVLSLDELKEGLEKAF